MAYTAQTPIVFLACVNSFRNGKRIRYLVKERKILSDILAYGRQKPLYEPVIKDPASHFYFFDYLHKHIDLNRVRVIHFHGPAENDHLRVESGKADTSIHVNELSKFIALLPNLELVYLHGCATPTLMEMLIRRDVPAIMVSETQQRDSRCMKVAKTFYQEVARGASVKKALMSIQHDFPHFGEFRLHYQFETDQVHWPFELEEGKLPWGLYFLRENESRLYQPISDVDKEGLSIPIFDGQKSAREEERATYRLAAIAAAIGVILGLSLYFVQEQAEGLRQLLAF